MAHAESAEINMNGKGDKDRLKAGQKFNRDKKYDKITWDKCPYTKCKDWASKPMRLNCELRKTKKEIQICPIRQKVAI